jgi:predicted metal-dependent HD superfamily phosphohydrolase
MALLTRWLENWAACGIVLSSALETEYRVLTQAYKESHRCYHNLQHLVECFHHFDWAIEETEKPEEVQLAIWYHDSVYDPHQSDNELRSAQWAERSLKAFGVPATKIERIIQMILATAGHHYVGEGDMQCMLDIDLAILGSSAERFHQYESQIHKEYDWVPEIIYHAKRRAVLESFLAKNYIYGNRLFRDRFEEQARSNIRNLLDQI